VYQGWLVDPATGAARDVTADGSLDEAKDNLVVAEVKF
jgi:hypothetical protein